MTDTLLEWLNLPGETAAAWLIEHVSFVAEIFALDDGRGRATLVITISVLAWIAVALLVPVALLNYLDRQMLAAMTEPRARLGSPRKSM